jgi:hypothetical protein
MVQGQDYALTSTFLWIGIIVGEPIVSSSIRPTTRLTMVVG